MLQNGWQHQQPHGDFQHTFYAGPQGFPQQYALVPLNGGAGMMNGPQQHPMPPAGPPPGMIMPPGPSMGPSQMMRSPGMDAFKYALHAGDASLTVYFPASVNSSTPAYIIAACLQLMHSI